MIKPRLQDRIIFWTLPLGFSLILAATAGLWRVELLSLLSYCRELMTGIMERGDRWQILLLMILSGVIVTVITRSVWTLGLEAWRSFRFQRLIDSLTLPVPPRLRRVITRLNITVPYRVVRGATPQVLVYGWWRPRLLISDTTLDLLTDRELCAVLLHEQCHAHERHPWKAVWSHVLEQGFFFLTFLKDWRTGSLIRREVAADNYATKRLGEKRTLASAMLKFADFEASDLCRQTTAVSGFSLLNKHRVLSLVTDKPPRVRLALDRLIISFTSLAVIGLMLLLLFSRAPEVMAGTDKHLDCQSAPYTQPVWQSSIHQIISYQIN